MKSCSRSEQRLGVEPARSLRTSEAEVVGKTLEEKLADDTHWSCRLMAKRSGLMKRTLRADVDQGGGLMDYGRYRIEYFKLSTGPTGIVEKLRDVAGSLRRTTSGVEPLIFAFDERRA